MFVICMCNINNDIYMIEIYCELRIFIGTVHFFLPGDSQFGSAHVIVKSRRVFVCSSFQLFTSH